MNQNKKINDFKQKLKNGIYTESLYPRLNNSHNINLIHQLDSMYTQCNNTLNKIKHEIPDAKKSKSNFKYKLKRFSNRSQEITKYINLINTTDNLGKTNRKSKNDKKFIQKNIEYLKLHTEKSENEDLSYFDSYSKNNFFKKSFNSRPNTSNYRLLTETPKLSFSGVKTQKYRPNTTIKNKSNSSVSNNSEYKNTNIYSKPDYSKYFINVKRDTNKKINSCFNLYKMKRELLNKISDSNSYENESDLKVNKKRIFSASCSKPDIKDYSRMIDKYEIPYSDNFINKFNYLYGKKKDRVKNMSCEMAFKLKESIVKKYNINMQDVENVTPEKNKKIVEFDKKEINQINIRHLAAVFNQKAIKIIRK